MNIIENVYEAAFILITSAGGGALIIWYLSSYLGKVWANRILESEKAKYSRELDGIRHQFQIELNRVSIIHENQKESFHKVILALSKAIKALEQAYDEEWHPISELKYDELRNVMIEESLFLGKEGEDALNIFLSYYAKSTSFPEIDRQSDRMLRNIYEFLNYIDGGIREYFRKRIGLSDEKSPLFDIYLLDICLILNDYHHRGRSFSFNEVFHYAFNTSPLVLIEKYKSNLDSLMANMRMFVELVEADGEDGKFYFGDLSRVRKYLNILATKS